MRAKVFFALLAHSWNILQETHKTISAKYYIQAY